MLIGLETSKTVAAILEFVFGSVLVMADDSYAKNLCVAGIREEV